MNRTLVPPTPVYTWLLHYWADSDVLSLSFRPGRAAYSVEDDSGLTHRFDLDNDEWVGIEILDYESDFLPLHPELAAIWPTLRGSTSELTIEGDALSESHLIDAIRPLLAA